VPLLSQFSGRLSNLERCRKKQHQQDVHEEGEAPSFEDVPSHAGQKPRDNKTPEGAADHGAPESGQNPAAESQHHRHRAEDDEQGQPETDTLAPAAGSGAVPQLGEPPQWSGGPIGFAHDSALRHDCIVADGIPAEQATPGNEAVSLARHIHSMRSSPVLRSGSALRASKRCDYNHAIALDALPPLWIP
jgi:hypothetical protein